MRFNKILRKIKYNKIKVLGLITLFIACMMSVGFSYMSQKLEMKGLVNVYNSFSVRIINLTVSEMNNQATTQYNPNYNMNDFSVTSILPNIDSSITYKIVFKNYSMDKEAKLNKIIQKSMSNDNMEYILSVKEGDLINSNSTKDVYLTVKYKQNITLPEDKNVGIELDFDFIENEEESSQKYTEGNMLLNLRALDEPINNIWYDNEKGYGMKLNNVSYDSENKRYVFNGNSYATLEKAIIPEVGDFTLEIRASFPNNMDKVSDQAIISQVSNTSNDDGRFKLNAYTTKGTSVIRLFMNDTTNSSVNPAINFTSQPISEQEYLMQVVRENDQFKLYLDGNFITTYYIPTEAKISQEPLKIGRWNDKSPQYYNGEISTIRLYNRALNSNELLINKNIDDDLYYQNKEPDPEIDPEIPIEVKRNIKTYAISNHLTSSNDGLYLDSTNKYVYRGLDVNNYLKFSNNNDIYRIISYNTDGTMKIINATKKFNIPFDESGNRNDITSTYCEHASTIADASINQFYGCNAWNSANSLTNGKTTGIVSNDSSSNIYLNTIYYNSLSDDMKSKILTHDFDIGLLNSNVNRDQVVASSQNLKWNGKIGMITAADVFNASIASSKVSSSQTNMKNYLLSLQINNEIYWTMTGSTDNTWDIYSMVTASSVGKRRASRYNQKSGNTMYTMYAVPSFYINSDVEYSGTGTQTDPFIVK